MGASGSPGRLDLAALFDAHRGTATEPDARDALEARLNALCAEARVAWPALEVEPAQFVAYLAERTSADEPLIDALGRLHVADLYLACGCAAGQALALAALERVLSGATGFIARVDRDPSFVDEVTQLTRERLLVAPAAGAPRIVEYSGRGSLASWVGVVAQRIAISLKRRDRPSDALDEDELADGELGAQAAAELDYIKARHRVDFRAALADAFAELPERDRFLLKLYYLDGLSLHKLGRLKQVNASTISRWLAEAREALLDGTRRRLRERLRLGPDEFESLVRLVRSSLDISMFRLLDARADG